jgi:uncharacterized protein YxeA
MKRKPDLLLILTLMVGLGVFTSGYMHSNQHHPQQNPLIKTAEQIVK